MYRKSSPGNPYHDSLGRFTSAAGASFIQTAGIFVDVSEMTTEEKKETSKEIIYGEQKEHTDNYYFNQSCDRHEHADNVSRVGIQKYTDDMSEKEKEKVKKENYEKYKRGRAEFDKENRCSIERGAKVHTYYNSETGEICYTLCQSSRRVVESGRDGSVVDSSTNMEQFSGYTVSYTDDNVVASTRKDASLSEKVEAYDKFCRKNSEILSNKGACVKISETTDERMMFTTVMTFKTQEAAMEFAYDHRGSKVTDNKGNTLVHKSAMVEESEVRFNEGYNNLKNKEVFAAIKPGEVVYSDVFGKKLIKKSSNEVINTETGEILSRTAAKDTLSKEKKQVLDSMGKHESTLVRIPMKKQKRKEEAQGGKSVHTQHWDTDRNSAKAFEKKVADKLRKKEEWKKAKK